MWCVGILANAFHMKSCHRQAKLYNLYVCQEPEMILSLLLPLLGSQSMTQLQHSNCFPSTNKTASPSYIEVSAPVCWTVPSRAVSLPIMPFQGTVIAGVLCLFAHTRHWVQKWHETNADLHCFASLTTCGALSVSTFTWTTIDDTYAHAPPIRPWLDVMSIQVSWMCVISYVTWLVLKPHNQHIMSS